MYGAEHLLRLFVKLPELLAAAVATEQQASQVAIMVQVCVRWVGEGGMCGMGRRAGFKRDGAAGVTRSHHGAGLCEKVGGMIRKGAK